MMLRLLECEVPVQGFEIAAPDLQEIFIRVVTGGPQDV
jgi:hypothetical protein